MNTTAVELESMLEEFLPQLHAVSSDTERKPSPSKWSKKELMGHLIDSAQNNIRRFIVTQYEEHPKIIYDQDQWVRINHYQAHRFTDLIEMWRLHNKQICFILNNTSPEIMQRTCETGTSHTLEWLAQDYLRHLRHHLHQILDLTAFDYP